MSALPPKADIGEGIAECPLMTQSGHWRTVLQPPGQSGSGDTPPGDHADSRSDQGMAPGFGTPNRDLGVGEPDERPDDLSSAPVVL